MRMKKWVSIILACVSLVGAVLVLVRDGVEGIPPAVALLFCSAASAFLAYMAHSWIEDK